MATLPRAYSTSEQSKAGGEAAVGGGGGGYKKSKRLSWTLGRKKSRDEAIVADGSGK